MKLNLPSSLTREKMLTIFLLTFLQSNGVEAGLGSRQCLIDNGYAGYYEALLNFPFANNNEINNNQILFLCCNNSSHDCFLSKPVECFHPNRRFLCNKVSQSITCIGGGCRSVIGYKPISDNAVSSSCGVSFEMMENYFAFSFDSGAFYVDKNNQYATGVCPTHSTCSSLVENMTCGGDNGGGTCCDYGSDLSDFVGSFGNNTYVDGGNKCFLQGKSPFPSKKNKQSFLNRSGLLTPGPISIISAIFSIAGVFTFETEKYSASGLAKSILTYNIVRSLATLIGSGSSLIGGGIRKFEYSADTLLTSNTLLFSMLSIKLGINRRQQRNVVREEIPMRNLQEEENEEESNMEEANISSERKKLEKLYSLRYLCGAIVGISFAWQLFATVIYGLHKNLPASARFITNCTSVPTNATGISYFECDENNRCFIKDGNSDFQDLLTRSYSMFVVISSTIALGLIEIDRLDLSTGPFRINLDRGFGQRRSTQVRNFIRYIIYSVIAFFIATQAIGSTISQTLSTLNIKGLENCDINGNELSSKTGYIGEGAKQNGTSIDEAISGISRKIALS